MPSLLDRILRRDPDALPRTVRVDRALDLLGDGALLVDVREPGEWRSGHARQARHIPLGRLDSEARRLPKDRAVVVMCASGMRSRGAAARLRAEGYRATSLSGGLAAWRAAGGDVVTR
ncbi:rhodanese-like domain-containing protein [Actinotalea sp. K2]|uniref:rhodanese-like domain-containing protein n=1 Tax=Actinotalea sp. K2 TaxID=2939438 RepID=UPI00201738DE|nr:rhodanese-like domain-containing protein [Actinotalea sp. K2]MCL3861465.1 rhodanese-like domain-containing protein [Actinotalea sp. K2]